MVLVRHFSENRGTGGFTLVEVLVAVAIFATISVIAFTGLQSSMKVHERLQVAMESASDLQLAMTVLQQDIGSLVRRPIYPAFGDSRLPAFDDRPPAEQGALGVYTCILGFTTVGTVVTKGFGNHMRRIAYCLDAEGRMIRLVWKVLDRAQDTAFSESVLLEGVEFLKVRPHWPEDRVEYREGSIAWLEIMPKSIEVELRLKNSKTYRRIFKGLDNHYPSLLYGPRYFRS